MNRINTQELNNVAGGEFINMDYAEDVAMAPLPFPKKKAMAPLPFPQKKPLAPLPFPQNRR